MKVQLMKTTVELLSFPEYWDSIKIEENCIRNSL